MPKTKVPSWLSERPIAHRGMYSDGLPENSLSAFEAAIQQEYAIECDVQLSADHIPMVVHDLDLQRLTGRSGLISQLALADIKQRRLLSTNETIPTLEEVLNFVAGRVPLLIEIKNEHNPGILEIKVSKSLASYTGEVAVQSFNPLVVLWFKAHAPNIIRGQLAQDFSSQHKPWYLNFLLKNMLFNGVTCPDFVAYNISHLPRKAVANFRNVGKPVLGWTIRSDQDLLRARKYCDNFIFERIKI